MNRVNVQPNQRTLSEDDALFLDFDGTLTPIQNDPDMVELAPGFGSLLVSLSEKLNGAVAIISGRDLSDLIKRVPENLWRLGNHGLTSAAPGLTPSSSPIPAPANMLDEIAAICGDIDGVRIEPKGPIVAIHYRAVPTCGDEMKASLRQMVAKFDGYQLQHGKCVFEVKPISANKGTNLSKMMQQEPFKGRRPVMFGDDTTDEDAFVVVTELGGVSFKVGEGESVAQHRLADVINVYETLKEFECCLKG